MLTLKKITPEQLTKIKSGLQEIKNNPTPFDIRAVQKMIQFMDIGFQGYLEELKKAESSEQPAGRVPNTVLLLFDDDKFVGVYDVRHQLTPALMKQGGNIAYQIIPSERQKGYVKAGLKLVLIWCHKNLNLDKVLLFCNQKNVGSDRAMSSVMEEMGGTRVPDQIYEDHIERGVWIYTHPTKMPHTCKEQKQR